MAWKMYKVVFRLLTPLHIGHIKLGNVQRTRHYVTGKALWGALTARLTRDCPELGGDYVMVGKRVYDELAFSYFYPAVSEEVKPFPWDDPDEFTWRYLNTYASTALDYGRNSAEDGSLHETEFIAPRTRPLATGKSKQVYLVGYVFEREDCTLQWQDALERLQLGGERTYGWGRVECNPEKNVTPATEFFEGVRFELGGAHPVVGLTRTQHLIAHTAATGLNNVIGRVEPLIGRETNEASAHGKVLKDARICWAPGAQVVTETWLQIGSYGIWHAIGGQ